MEERKDLGKALSPEREALLLDAIGDQTSPNRFQVLGTFVRVLCLPACAGEITNVTWAQVDFALLNDVS